MKSFITALVIAAVIFIGSMFYNRELDSLSETMLDYNNQIMNMLHNEDYPGAAGQVQALTDYVETKKIPLSMIIDHATLDKIENSLAELAGYVEGRAKTDALAKSRTLDVLFQYIPKNYKLRLENIL